MSTNRRPRVPRDASGTFLREILPPPPMPLTSFIGRAHELAELERLLPAHRLLTLSGPGGIGKSRLAMEIARSVEVRGGPDVCFVELALISDPSLVPQTVASALGLREQPERAYVEQLVDALRLHPILLVLDNCEHLVAECARLVGRLLTACPSLVVLATSRASLGVAGERVWAVPPLSMPGVDSAPWTADQIERSEAGLLFLERARLRHAGLELTAEDAANVATICRRLDGLPLALELAAARTAVLAPSQIVERLEDRFALLTGGGQLAPPRHRTLRALVDWSYGLLSEAEQAVLRRASVFAGSWEIGAHAAVCGGGIVDGADVLDLLQRLIDQSLVVVEAGVHGRRYRLLETIQAYARERLIEAGEEPGTLRQHCSWYLRLAEQGGAELWGAGQKAWLGRLDADLSNLRAAITWCVDRARQSTVTAESEGSANGDEAGELALRFGGALLRFWEAHGYLREGRRLLTAILDVADLAIPSRVDTLNATVYLLGLQGDLPSTARYLRASGDLARQIGYRPGLYLSLVLAGGLAMWQGQYDEAMTSLAEAERMVSDVEPSLPRYIGQMIAGYLFGGIYQVKGELEKAASALAPSLKLARETGDKATQSHLLIVQGNLDIVRGNIADSEARHREALRLQLDHGDRSGIRHSLEGIARAAGTAGLYERSAWLFGGAEALAEATGVLHTIAPWQALNEPVIEAVRTALGRARFAGAWAEGKGATFQEILDRALSADVETQVETGTTAPPIGDPRRAAPGLLTAREIEVAALIARGYTNRQIANELVITERTAETHTRHIREKLGFSSRTQVAAWAIEHGLSRPS